MTSAAVESALRRLRRQFPAFSTAAHAERRSNHCEPTPVVASDPAPGVLQIHLAGGHRRNVLGRSTIERIENLVEFAPAAVQVILLTADGPDFSAGYDLIEAQENPAALLAHEANFAPLRRTGKPVVAALSGNVIGGGLELALAADLRIATRDTKFAIPASRLGLVYSEAGTRLLVNLLGESVARAMLVGGRVLNASDALTLGLVSEVVAAEDLSARALAVATEIASWPSVASAGNRQMVDVVVGRVEIDTDALRSRAFLPDGALAHAIAVFAERRKHASEHHYKEQARVRGEALLHRGEELMRAGRARGRDLGRTLVRFRPSH